MRSLLFLAAICCLALVASGSPVPDTASPAHSQSAVARQAAAAPAPAVPQPDDDDDDEDDDDDDDDIALDDDDDDDEDDDDEADDDDDDDDYLERFFDDILGDDEDEDEEETVASIVPAVDTVAAAASPTGASQSATQAAAAGAEEVAAAAEDADGAEVASADVADEAVPEAEKEPASPEANQVAEPVEDDDDDDDDDEDIGDALEDDDDDDEEEDDDDDDDDDELVGDDLGRNTKHSRKGRSEEQTTEAGVEVAGGIEGMEGKEASAYIARYNRFVDNILDKMNSILRASYDPVSVKLQPIDASKKKDTAGANSATTKKPSKKKSGTKKKDSARTEAESEKLTDQPQDTSVTPKKVSSATHNTTKIKKPSKKKSGTKSNVAADKKKAKPSEPGKPKKKVNKQKTSGVKAAGVSKPRARGTLYGLSSLRRSGDVAVSLQRDHTAVKAAFALGPLVLKVEKEVGRGAKKQLKSATATTAELRGRLTLRVGEGGAATLHSIRVLQPDQVSVSARMARLVSAHLAAALASIVPPSAPAPAPVPAHSTH